jgi:hypothetical protein
MVKMNCKIVLFTFYHSESGFFIFIHCFTLITNTKVSKMTCRHLMRRLWTQKLLKNGVFIWFSMVLMEKPQVPFIRSSTCEKPRT